LEQQETPFQPGWLSVPLPSYRTSSTSRYSYYELPPIPNDAFLRDFEWIQRFASQFQRKQHHNLPLRSEERLLQRNLGQIMIDAEQQQIRLPQSFISFMSNASLQRQKPFSHFDFDLPEHLQRSSVFREYSFVRFLHESGGSQTFHVCLNRNSEYCVIASYVDLSDPDLLKRWKADGSRITPEDIRNASFYCAPSFEHFLYRYWIEHYVLHYLINKIDLPDELKPYVAYYAAQQ
jgi:hypothetical protein